MRFFNIVTLDFKENRNESTCETKEGEGFEALLSKRITVFCAIYIYTGDLVGVNNTCIKLENPAIVYETGSFNEKAWKDAQKLPNTLYI